MKKHYMWTIKEKRVFDNATLVPFAISYSAIDQKCKKKSVIINCQLSRAMDLNRGQFCSPTLSHPQDEGQHLGISGDIFGCHDWGRWLLLASSGKRPRMLLSILQCTEQSPQQRIVQLKVSIVLNLRNRDLKKV